MKKTFLKRSPVFLWGLLSTCLLFSCQKEIMLKEGEENNDMIFKAARISKLKDPNIKELAKLIELDMSDKILIRQFKKQGYPLWDKAISVEDREGFEQMIPFTKTGKEVSAVLISQKIGGQFRYSFITKDQFDGAKHGNRLSLLGKKMFMTLLLMENHVYGKLEFDYPVTAIEDSTDKIRSQSKIRLAPPGLPVKARSGNRTLDWEIREVCLTWNKYCKPSYIATCGNGCDMCSECVAIDCNIDHVWHENREIHEDGDGGGGGGGGEGITYNTYQFYTKTYSPAIVYLREELNLDDLQSDWLASTPTRETHAEELKNFIANTMRFTSLEAKSAAWRSFYLMYTDSGYESFLDDYAAIREPGQNVWWEDTAWMADSDNVDLIVDGTTDYFDALGFYDNEVAVEGEDTGTTAGSGYTTIPENHTYHTFVGTHETLFEFKTTAAKNSTVHPKLINAVDNVIHQFMENNASMFYNPLHTIFISSASEYDPTHSATSNHGKGLAVDISRINRVPVRLLPAGHPLVVQLQNLFDLQADRRENYGPYFIHKLGVYHDPGSDHSNHLHFSVTP